MESNKYFPNFIGEVRLGNYYVSPFVSIKVDSNLRSIWLDLETPKKSFSKKVLGGFNFSIMRKSLGGSNDFIFNFKKEYLNLFNIFTGSKLSIPNIINFILNPIQLGEKHEELSNRIAELTSHFSDDDKSYLVNFSNLISSFPKESMNKLLHENKYSLVFGELDESELYENNVITQKRVDLKTQSITPEILEKYFGNIVLSKKTLNEVFVSLGIGDIISNPPKLPTVGGSIFIDMGGTGKSMMKSALTKFWTMELGGEVVEKDGIAEFSGDTNYATLIRSWYYGSKNDENPKYDKDGLFNIALKNKVPSLLIIDEAERFIRTSRDGYSDGAADSIVTEFKKYLTGRDKGGVQGHVLTLFIANVERSHLNPQLAQGGERLSVVHFGPPTTQVDWLKLINMYFNSNNLFFSDRDDKKDILLANLILKHNSYMSSEEFMIPPRKFGSSFCGTYKKKYLTKEKKISDDNIFHSLYHGIVDNEESYSKIKYENFFKFIIDDLLMVEVKKAKLNDGMFRKDYYNFVGLNFDNSSGSNSNHFSVEELKELEIILGDSVVRRIISANYLFEVLGIIDVDNFNDSQELKKLITKLIFKIGAQNYIFKDLDNNSHTISTDIGKELLKELFNKLPNSKLDIKDLKVKAPVVDFSKFNI
jgi:hypothetical protein